MLVRATKRALLTQGQILILRRITERSFVLRRLVSNAFNESDRLLQISTQLYSEALRLQADVSDLLLNVKEPKKEGA